MTDAVTLVAVVTVVLLVSLPRLRHFALRENESDARQVVRTLAELISGAVEAAEPQEALDVGTLLEASPRLEDQWRDVEVLADGALLRRHGYLFEVLDGESGVAVRAWPWQHGRTGLCSYVWRPATGVLVHDDPGGVWTGDNPPPLTDLATSGWRPLLAD